MKKTIISAALMLAALSAVAQKSKIRDTRDYLNDQNYKKAIPVANEAVANEDTKNNPEAWYLRGMAYLQQAVDTAAKAPNAADESLTSLMKALTLKPDYSPEINNGLYSNALLQFNKGVTAYSGKSYDDAYNSFQQVVKIYNVGNGKRFAGDKGFTDLVASARSNAAYSALNAKNDANALASFNELKSTAAGKKDSNVYQAIIEITQRMSNDAQLLAAITDARTQFPNYQPFRNAELNYYIRSGKQDMLLTKLEDAVKIEPGNAELQFNLANAYQNAAFPKDAGGKDMARPANYAELFGKAETAYQQAVNASPSNADYHYNYGVLYYGAASELNWQMNTIKGMSAAEQKQYDALMKDRDAQFAKALPHLEDAYSKLDGRAASLTQDEKVTYQKTMIGVREIYSRQNNKAKTDALKAKLDALK